MSKGSKQNFADYSEGCAFNVTTIKSQFQVKEDKSSPAEELRSHSFYPTKTIQNHILKFN